MKMHAFVIAAALAFALSACSMQRTGELDRSAPFPSLRPGSDAEPLTSSIRSRPPFAIACEGVTFFVGDHGYRRCLETRDFTAIYRVGSQQYAYTVSGQTIVETLQTSHTVTYP